MVQILYVEHDGEEHLVELEDGENLMAGAKAHGVRGIDGDCGGVRACATCHVYVDANWLEKLEPPTEGETGMLELAIEPAANSRLACQIIAHDAINGIIVRMPIAQS